MTGLKVIFGFAKRMYENRDKTPEQLACEESIKSCFFKADEMKSEGNVIAILFILALFMGVLLADKFLRDVMIIGVDVAAVFTI